MGQLLELYQKYFVVFKRFICLFNTSAKRKRKVCILSNMNSIYKSGNALIIKVSSEIYSKEAVSSTCYKYLKDYFINQLNNEQEKCIEVTLESKNSAEISDIVGKQFMNNLIDQQVRENVNKEFSHIRDLIVEQAFKPVNN